MNDAQHRDRVVADLVVDHIRLACERKTPDSGALFDPLGRFWKIRNVRERAPHARLDMLRAKRASLREI